MLRSPNLPAIPDAPPTEPARSASGGLSKAWARFPRGARPRTRWRWRSGRPAASRAREHRRLDVRRNVLPLRRERPRLLGHHPREDRLRGRPGERRLAGEHLVGHRAERVDVASARRSPARPSPARGSCSAACRATGRSASCGCRRPAATASAMPKSATSARAVVQQDVLRLDVAVDDAVAVRVVERAATSRAMRSASATGSCFSRSRRARSDLALDVRHHVEEQRRRPRRESNSGRMCGCCRVAVVRISARNRSAPMTAASSGWSTLSATWRSWRRSSGEVDGGHAARARARARSRSGRARLRQGEEAHLPWDRLYGRRYVESALPCYFTPSRAWPGTGGRRTWGRVTGRTGKRGTPRSASLRRATEARGIGGLTLTQRCDKTSSAPWFGR